MNKLIKWWRNIPLGVKASVAYFLASIVTKAIGYLVTPIFTRLLSPAEYGQVSVYLTWKDIAGIIAMFCLTYGTFNVGLKDHEQDRDRYSFSVLLLSNIITAVSGVVILSVAVAVGGFSQMPFPFLLLMLAVFFSQPAMNFWLLRQRYEYRYKGPVLISVLTTVLSAASATVWIFVFRDNRAFGKAFGTELVTILFGIGFYIYLAYKSKMRVNRKYWREAFLFNLPLIPHYLSTYLLSSSDKVMIAWLIDKSATAYYSVAYSIAAVVMVIWTAANTSLVPYTYEKCKENDFDAISRVTLPILAVFSIACMFIILLAPEAISLIAPSSYKQAIYAVPPIIGGVFFQTNYYIYANIIFYYKKTKYVLLGSFTAVTLNILLNYICIPRFGYIAAGYTTLLGYLVQAAIDYCVMRRILHNSVYQMKYIGLLAGGIILVAIFSNLLYATTVLRYGLVAVLLILAVIFRKKIIRIFLFSKKEGSET